MIRPLTVRALDVGYGNTKYSTNCTSGRTSYRSFASLAPTAIATDVAAGSMQRRNTVVVAIDGRRYEVGPDAEFATDCQHAHVIDDSYVTRPEYRALSLGALTYMGATTIDLLVVGLPVSRVESQASCVRECLLGQHQVGELHLDVKKVVVIAQPVGGALNTALAQNRLEQFRSETTLTLDIGAGTDDALVSRGLQVLPKRCATHPGGTGAMLRQLADAVLDRYGVQCPMQALENALRYGALRLAGNEVPILPLLAATRPVVDQAINALMARVGSVADIDRIVLVGGGARFFQPGIRARFPDHPIEIAESGIFANVRGFQIAGERLAGTGGAP